MSENWSTYLQDYIDQGYTVKQASHFADERMKRDEHAEHVANLDRVFDRWYEILMYAQENFCSHRPCRDVMTAVGAYRSIASQSQDFDGKIRSVGFTRRCSCMER